MSGSSFEELFSSGGQPLAPPVSRPFLESGTFVFPTDGVVIMRALGGGGSGAISGLGAPGTGGYSGGWGVVAVKVKAGDVATVTVGAGGANPGTTTSNGLAGGNTTIVLNGVTYMAPGGPGGVYVASGTPTVPDGPAPSSNWLIKASSVKPGAFAGKTGGAGVDILAKGGNATTSAASNSSGGGGTGGPSVDIHGGGAITGGYSLTGERYSVSYSGSDDQWGIPLFGGSGGQGFAATTAGGKGGNGGGGGGSQDTSTGGADGGDGGLGGGGGASYRKGGGNGGLGAGGGGGASTAVTYSKGGNGYAYIRFYPYLQV